MLIEFIEKVVFFCFIIDFRLSTAELIFRKSFLHKLLHYSFKISPYPIHVPLVLHHENFIQQGFKFPVMKSDLIKLIDSNEAFKWGLRGRGLEIQFGDKEIRYLLYESSTSHAITSKHNLQKFSACVKSMWKLNNLSDAINSSL